MTRVALLWHMHQPYYEDLVTREHILPWVRLHALKDYYGMVAMLEEFPTVRITFNLVPSMLVQLEAFAEERAHDRYLDVGLRPADALSHDDVAFILQNFFHAQRHHMIESRPRYAELLGLKGHARSRSDIASAARRFTTDDLRDLQVWQKLAWIDPIYLDGDARVRALLEKGRGFSEDDKLTLRDVELDLLRQVIPAYRARAEAGQIEISTSPFYHPILPLLCDTDVYLQTHPASPMPRHRFVRPADAADQLERAAVYHERLFGQRPTGLWPSEGSVSDAILPLVQKAGFSWMATDELILARTLHTTFARDASGQVDQPERLYAPYRVTAHGADVACGFRDHALSDQIGFQYSNWPADRAAEDFVTRLEEAGRRARSRSGEEPTIFVILDGENAWEHFEGGGRPFLKALYGRLAHSPEIETVTMAEACRAPGRTLDGIFPGSWIDANFYIWIGHADDRRGWSQLAEARDTLDAAEATGALDVATHARAREEILIAEGSDWFWWYGDDHSSDHDAEFDDLFRRHLRNVYRLLERPVPDELFVTNISAGLAPIAQLDPVSQIAPVIDGEDSSYFEWLGAGEFEVRDMAGAMHQTDREAAILTRVYFGSDEHNLYVRLDGAEPMSELLERGYALTVTFLAPEGLRLLVRSENGRASGSLWLRAGGPERWSEGGFSGSVAAGSILECVIPVDDLHVGRLPQITFVVTVCDAAGAEIERHPTARPLEMEFPDAAFDARHWTA